MANRFRSGENEFANYVGCGSRGRGLKRSTALHLAVAAADLSAGDEILVSASTNIATALAAVHNQCEALPVETDDLTWTISISIRLKT